MKRKNWMKIAQAIAKSKGWIAWVSTIMMIKEKTTVETSYFEVSFKVKREPTLCPHCGKAIYNFDGTDGYVYVSDPRNFIAYRENLNAAWKELVSIYAKTFKKTIAEIELELNIGGYL